MDCMGLGMPTEAREGTVTASLLPGALFPHLFVNKHALAFLKCPAFGSWLTAQ